MCMIFLKKMLLKILNTSRVYLDASVDGCDIYAQAHKYTTGQIFLFPRTADNLLDQQLCREYLKNFQGKNVPCNLVAKQGSTCLSR